jgi:DNA polymerase-4
MTASVGIAPNPLLAKVASDFQKPRGLSIINVSDIPHKLFRLELTDWPGISVNMYERFLKAGVRSTEDMYRLDVHQMRAVFGGIEGERWWSEIRGHEVWRPPMVRRQVGHSSVLEPAMRTPDLAWSVACRLVERVSMARSAGSGTPRFLPLIGLKLFLRRFGLSGSMQLKSHSAL